MRQWEKQLSHSLTMCLTLGQLLTFSLALSLSPTLSFALPTICPLPRSLF